MAGKFPCPEAIASAQLTQLRALLKQILPGNRFYAQKFSGLTKSLTRLADFSRFPFTTKQELVEDQHRNPIFGTNLSFPLERYTRFHQTSGTTATPVRWLDTPESWNWMVENWCEVFRAAKIGAHERVNFAFTFGPLIE
jgi:phenylacetate-CoA ligase